MRGSEPGGRFSVDSELDRILSGMTEDLRRPVGGDVAWWRYDEIGTGVDPIYDVGSSEAGRRWLPPLDMPFIVAQVFQGETYQNDRGLYNADVLRLTMNMNDVMRVIPTLVQTPDAHIRDRIVYRGSVFRPSRLYFRGQVLSTYTVLTVDLIQVKSEELVNDDQFQAYAS